jgi:hypothetical protein
VSAFAVEGGFMIVALVYSEEREAIVAKNVSLIFDYDYAGHYYGFENIVVVSF